jgi:hypothetical protein
MKHKTPTGSENYHPEYQNISYRHPRSLSLSLFIYLFTSYVITHGSRINQGMLKIFGSKKQGKLQWLLDPSQINPDNLNNSCETCRHV